MKCDNGSQESVNLSRRQICCGIGLSLISMTVKGGDTDGSIPNQKFRVFPQTFSMEKVFIEPPPNSDLAEADELLKMKKLRTPERLQQISRENENPIPLFWSEAGLSEDNYPAISRKVYDAVFDVAIVVLNLKKQFNRKRPSAVLTTIDPVIPVPWHASYPNGHTTQSIVIAAILSESFPEHAAGLQALASQVGRNREIAGLHFPSDTDAGFALGKQLAKYLVTTTLIEP